jgi:Flp pilus assembly protein TadD
MRGIPLVVLGLTLVWAQSGRAQADGRPNFEHLLAEGNAAAQAGDFDLAIARFEKALEVLDADSPAAGDLYLRVGETYRRKGDLEAAVRSLARANELLPGNATVIGTLALALDSSGNRTEAQRAYRAALDVDPNNAIAMNNLAFLLAEGGEDLEDALRLSRRAMELMPAAMEITDTAGWVQLKRGENDAAIALFAQAVSGEPADEGFRDHLLLALERKGDHSGLRGETIAALKAVATPESLAKLTALIQGLK